MLKKEMLKKEIIKKGNKNFAQLKENKCADKTVAMLTNDAELMKIILL
jgi:hypothetical protein